MTGKEPLMRAVACADFGGPDQLLEVELDQPPVGPNDVLVRLAYAGLNPGDSRIRQGEFVPQGRHVFPLVLGMEDAAVDTVGGAAQDSLTDIVRPGGRVASCVHPATNPIFAERDQYVGFTFLEATPERLARLDEHVACGRVRPRITDEFALADAAQAHRAIDAGLHRGKLVLRIGEGC